MKQPKHPRTKAQHAAALKFAAAGRSSQASTRAAAIAKTGKPPARSKKQTQASLRFAAAGRAAQARKRAHLKPLPKHQPALALPGAGLHGLPVCAAVAVAEHLYAATGVAVSDAAILDLAARTTGGCLGDYLAEAAAGGLGGVMLTGFRACDEDLTVPGLLYGVRFRGGYHAVLVHPYGMITWGMLLPRLGVPSEAWQLEWDSDLH